MKILLIGPLFANANHGAECGIFDAIRELGHEAWCWDPRDKKFANYQEDGSVYEGEWKPEIDWSWHKFDLVVCPGPGLADSVLETAAFKALDAPKVLWNSEPIRLVQYRDKVRNQKGVYDFTFTFDESEIELYEKMGIDAQWLPQAFNPEWYDPDKPVELNPPIQDSWDVGFCGSTGGKWMNREHLLRRLNKSFKLGACQVFDAVSVNAFYHKCKLIANLGLYVPGNGRPEDLRGFALQQRIFESIGAGRVCVTNEIPEGTNELFTHGEEILFYDSKNLEEVVEYGLDDRRRGRMEDRIRSIREQHTYAARVRQMLEVIE